MWRCYGLKYYAHGRCLRAVRALWVQHGHFGCGAGWLKARLYNVPCTGSYGCGVQYFPTGRQFECSWGDIFGGECGRRRNNRLRGVPRRPRGGHEGAGTGVGEAMIPAKVAGPASLNSAIEVQL
jgi:hypothetical protein